MGKVRAFSSAKEVTKTRVTSLLKKKNAKKPIKIAKLKQLQNKPSELNTVCNYNVRDRTSTLNSLGSGKTVRPTKSAKISVPATVNMRCKSSGIGKSKKTNHNLLKHRLPNHTQSNYPAMSSENVSNLASSCSDSDDDKDFMSYRSAEDLDKVIEEIESGGSIESKVWEGPSCPRVKCKKGAVKDASVTAELPDAEENSHVVEEPLTDAAFHRMNKVIEDEVRILMAESVDSRTKYTSNEDTSDSSDDDSASKGEHDIRARTPERNADDDISESDTGDATTENNEIKSHKLALEKLKDTDPEFYKFLTENDKKLLDFNIRDEDSDDEEDDAIHKPLKLEVASDDSDFEEDNDNVEASKKNEVTLKIIKTWERGLQGEQKSNSTIVEVTSAFHAAMQSIVPAKDDKPGKYQVKGSAAFNGVIQICVLYLGPAVYRFLNLKRKAQASKAKKFVKVKTCLGQYFMDLARLLRHVTSSNILNILLKHLHYMSSLLLSFSHATGPLLKRVYTLWATGDESVRVVAFLVVLRIVREEPQHLQSALKSMYMAYVKNTKFVSINTLPHVNFMRRSLVEIYALDLTAAYAFVFLFVRQLAINLRNAMVDNKRENVQVVCNWQFVSSCKMWGALLGQTADKPQLQPLIYPLVQVCLGSMRLVPNAAYYPMRFHLARIIIDLSAKSNVYVPVLPFLTQPLQTYNFNKKHTQVSMKPLSFDALLRASKSQMAQNGFKDTLIETIYTSVLEYAVVYAHTASFPDLILLALNHIRQFLKRSQNAQHKKRMRDLLHHLEHNSVFMLMQRTHLNEIISNAEAMYQWESLLKNAGTPLSKFYDKWLNDKMLKKRKQANKHDEIANYNLPELRKHLPKARSNDNGRVELLPSDSEDDGESTLHTSEPLAKRKRGSRGKRLGKRTNDPNQPSTTSATAPDHDDIVEDLVDW